MLTVDLGVPRLLFSFFTRWRTFPAFCSATVRATRSGSGQGAPHSLVLNEDLRVSSLSSEIVDRKPAYLATAKEILVDDADAAADDSSEGTCWPSVCVCTENARIDTLGR